MNLIRILKLLWKNVYFIIAIPVILAIVVNHFTKDEVLKYESETTLFTGLASGKSLDLSEKSFSIFAANNAFDNLLNLIKSREVASETGIRLIVQHLMLPEPDPTIIDPVNYQWVHSFVPEELKKLIVKPSPVAAGKKKEKTTEVKNDTVFLRNGDMVFKNRLYHFVQKDEDIKAIAKNYGISVSDILNFNELTTDGLTEGLPLIVRNDSLNGENSSMYDPTQVLHTPVVVELSDYEKSVSNFIAFAAKDDTNYLFRLLNSRNPYYGIAAISNVVARRVQNSDMVLIKFSSFDPGICQHTLIHMTDVVIKKFRSIKANESDAVVKYFLNEVNQTARRLQNAEDRLLKFNEQNSIINYYEQSKAVAVEKEDLDVAYQNEQVRFAASAAVLKRLEDRMGLMQTLQLKTSDILSLRNRLSEVTTQITMTESFKDPDPRNRAKLVDLRREAEQIKRDLHAKVGELYTSNTTVEGVPVDNVLTAWLDNVIAYEQSRASMKILANRVKEFFEYYKTFAPLGATQKRLEREISVAEQEYLSLLHSLNQSKLAQQNVELSSDIKAVDPPYLPLTPLPGKAGLLVVAAAIVGLVLVVFVIIALEFLDNTIRTPELLEEHSRLKVITAYPRIIPQYGNYDLNYISNRLIELVTTEIKHQTAESDTYSYPKIVLIASSMKGEGRTFIGKRIIQSFAEYGESAALLTPATDELAENTTSHPRRSFAKTIPGINWLALKLGLQNNNSLLDTGNEIDNPHCFTYQVNNAFFDSNNISDLEILGNAPPELFNYKYLLLEIPSILSKPFPRNLVGKAAVTLWITRSTRSWKKADKHTIESLNKTLKNRPIAILNGVEIDVIEDFLGELPKNRTAIRRFLKRFLTMQLHERKGIG